MAGRCVLKMDHYCTSTAISSTVYIPTACTPGGAPGSRRHFHAPAIQCHVGEGLGSGWELRAGFTYQTNLGAVLPPLLTDRKGTDGCRCVDSKHSGPVQLQGISLVSVLHILGMPARGLHAAGRGHSLLSRPGHCVTGAVQQVGCFSAGSGLTSGGAHAMLLPRDWDGQPDSVSLNGGLLEQFSRRAGLHIAQGGIDASRLGSETNMPCSVCNWTQCCQSSLVQGAGS